MAQRIFTHGVNGYLRGCRCDICTAAHKVSTCAASARYRASHPEQVKAYWAAWSQKNRDHLRDYNAAHYQANRAESAARSAAYRVANRDRLAAAQLARRRSDPEKHREDQHRRRVRLLGQDFRVVTERDWRRLCGRYDDRCAYCGRREPLTQDHVIPIVRGGRHSIGNLLPACLSCNSRKQTRLLVEWKRVTE